MVAEVFGGISALKAALDILKTVKDANDVAARQGIVIKLQEQILTAQAAQFDLIEQVRSLETEIANRETWDTDKQRYELRRVGPGAFPYVLKKEAAGSEPAHWICPNCYANRKCSILQVSGYAEKGGPDLMKINWSCPACRTAIRVDHSVSPSFE